MVAQARMEPIGPQKTKSQIQANKKISEEEDLGPAEQDILNPEEEEKAEDHFTTESSEFVITKIENSSTPESQKVKKSVDTIF